MSKAYFTSLESGFSKALAALFRENGFEVTTETDTGIEYFIDTTDYYAEGDDRAVGEGLNPEAAKEAFIKNVVEPVDRLDLMLPRLGGRKRICFLTSQASSVNRSEETAHFGHNMSKAAIHQILTISKNTLVGSGYTFRLFDPLTGEYPEELAAKSAFVYFTRDRFIDNDDNKDREDERNLIIRDAKGREIPW